MDKDAFTEGGGGAMGAQPLLDLNIFFQWPQRELDPWKEKEFNPAPWRNSCVHTSRDYSIFFKPPIFKGLENYSHLLLSLRRPPPPPFFHIDFRTHLALRPPRKLSSSSRVSPPRFWPSRRTC